MIRKTLQAVITGLLVAITVFPRPSFGDYSIPETPCLEDVLPESDDEQFSMIIDAIRTWKKEGKNPEAYGEIAELYLILNKVKEAQLYAMRALNLDKKNDKANHIMGCTYHLEGKELVREVNKLHAQLNANIGPEFLDIYFRKKKRSEVLFLAAKAYFDSALKQKPDNVAYLIDSGNLQHELVRGFLIRSNREISYNEKQQRIALERHKKAYRLKPSPRTLFFKVKSQLVGGEMHKALTDSLKIVNHPEYGPRWEAWEGKHRNLIQYYIHQN